MEDAIIITIILGLISTIQLHISKAMERQGIEIFDQIRAKLKKDPSQIEGGAKKPTIYLIGVILNNTIVIYAIIAGPYQNPQLFSGMFGIGLISLMIYSAKILKEEILKIEYIGAIIIVLGTLIIGLDSLNRPASQITNVDSTNLIIVLVCFLLVGFTCMYIAYKKNQPLIVGVIFGLFAGGCGGLDPFLKSVGQNIGISTEEGYIFPQSSMGWFIFIMSFGVAFFAFVSTQWGFAKKAKASVLVPAYNCTYVVLPLVFAAILYDFQFYWTTYLGVIFVIAGIILMRAFKPETKNIHTQVNPSIDFLSNKN